MRADPARRLLLPIAASILAVAVVTVAIAVLDNHVPVLSLGVLYVFAVLPVAVVWGLWFALPLSVACMLAFNFFFLPPTHTFSLRQGENWFALAVFSATAIVVSELTARSRRRAVAAEREVLDTLRRSDLVKTALLRTVSHDLRSPLTGIRTAVGALRSETLELSELDRRDLLETIDVDSERLARLVGDLLDMSRLEAGAALPDLELRSLEDVVRASVDASGGRVAVSGESPFVRVDAAQVQRVVANLVENALKFSPGAVDVEIASAGGEAVVRVSDRGPGLAETELERIFEPFYRSGDDRSGAGLGLAIARGFAEANGGRLWAEPRPGGGAVFVLAFPIAEMPVGLPA